MSFERMLEITNLEVKFKNSEKSVFSRLNFLLKKKEKVSIVGPSGCGKTTLLGVIGDLLSDEEVEISGNIKKTENLDIKYVFQDPLLLPWKNVAANIGFGLEIKMEQKKNISLKVDEMLELVGMKKYKNHYPHQLSRGMAQRVSFARALVCEPELLLLDEPFSSLDIRIRKKIQEDFLEIINSKNIAILFVTHDLEEARKMSDRIIAFPRSNIGDFSFVDNNDFGRAELETFF